jgi:sulfur carrier protein
MIVKINGDPREVPDGLTVSTLLDFLEMRNDRVAIEYNLNILPRAMWNGTKVQPNDNFEIVHFVGGG